MEEFLDADEHYTLDRDKDRKEEVIKPVMSESEDSSDSDDEQPSTSSSPKKCRYNSEFIKKVVEWCKEYKEKHKSYPSFATLQHRLPNLKHESM